MRPAPMRPEAREVNAELLAACEGIRVADRLNVGEWNAAMRLVDAALENSRRGAMLPE